jgi:hypothetical protein
MQTSTDVTTHPDALKASGTRLKVLECGGFQCRPVVLGDGLKQNVWGGSGKPKFGKTELAWRRLPIMKIWSKTAIS